MSKEEDQIERFLVKNTSGIVSLELRYFIFDNCSFVRCLCLCIKEAVVDNVNQMKNKFITLIMTKYRR